MDCYKNLKFFINTHDLFPFTLLPQLIRAYFKITQAASDPNKSNADNQGCYNIYLN